MEYRQIVKDCEKIKKIYGDVKVEVEDGYYVCIFNYKGIDFKFLLNAGKLDKPFSLSQNKGYDCENCMKAVKILLRDK